MPERVICDLCGQTVPPHAHYVVKIDVFADPSMPAAGAEEMEEKDFQQKYAALLKEIEKYSAEELQDQVHRRFEFKLCRPCQMQFLSNPLGKPRRRRTARN